MILEYAHKLTPLLLQIWTWVQHFLGILLEDLDPASLQNIILGILAIFIPYAIVFLTDILNTKKDKSEFEKMVFSEEVLSAKKIFWLSVAGIGFLAFFADKNTSFIKKEIAVIVTIIIVLLFGRFFKRILRFSGGHEAEFKISFLKSLKLSRFLRFWNKSVIEKLTTSWNSSWSEKNQDEREFTKIFIDHIDQTIKNKKYDTTVQLSQSYVKNIEKRDGFSLSYELLPKVFEWHETFWKKEQFWLDIYNREEKVKNLLPKKYFPTFNRWLSKFTMKFIDKRDNFWNWHYFQQEFIPKLTQILLKEGNGYEFFHFFKKYTDNAIENIDKLENKKEKDKYDILITNSITSFAETFFDNIESSPHAFDIWEHYFPKEWKVTSENFKKPVSRVFLAVFHKWTSKRIFDRTQRDYDKQLSEVVGGLFPGVHSTLFPDFLMLLYTPEIKYALEKKHGIFIIHSMLSWSGDKSEVDLNKMREDQELSQKDETIKVILRYFGFWDKLRLFKDDISEEENAKWKDFTEKERVSIVKRVARSKLRKMLDELHSKEIKDLCIESSEKETQRLRYIELITLLIKGLKEEIPIV